MNKSPSNIIIANYSVHSLALICWAKQNLQNDFCVLSVDTGFASYDWSEYLSAIRGLEYSEKRKYQNATNMSYGCLMIIDFNVSHFLTFKKILPQNTIFDQIYFKYRLHTPN